jgi:hypothetical protein
MLGRRPVADPAALATVVAECLGHLEAGLVLLARSASAGDVTVDVAGADARGPALLTQTALSDGRYEDAAKWAEKPLGVPRFAGRQKLLSGFGESVWIGRPAGRRSAFEA